MDTSAQTILAICGIAGFLVTIWTIVKKGGQQESNIDSRVLDLEKHYDDIAEDIKNIKENHLSHIQNDISRIQVNLERINTTLEFIKNK